MKKFKDYLEDNTISEAISVNTSKMVKLKSGDKGMFVERTTNGAMFYFQYGSASGYYEAKGDELKAIKEFFSKL